MPVKVLIIKLGYSETLDPEIGKVASLGDVLRTTPILWALKEKYPDSTITWLVAENAVPLLLGNPLIDRILVWDEFVPFQLMREKFDVLINLEKIAGVCALADMMDAWTKYGFRFESVSGLYHGYEKGLGFMNYIANKNGGTTKGHWQQVLIEMIGATWKEQPYIVGYQPKSAEIYDIGFNYDVGPKWPVKGMPKELWRALEKRFLDIDKTVSWQKGKANLHEYMDWINSCRLIISSDSLGMHLGLAFKKKVIGLFGPSDSHEVYFHDGSVAIRSPRECPRMPCQSPACNTGFECMKHFDLSIVQEAAEHLLKGEFNGCVQGIQA
jgi:heptosyltransferase-2